MHWTSLKCAAPHLAEVGGFQFLCGTKLLVIVGSGRALKKSVIFERICSGSRNEPKENNLVCETLERWVEKHNKTK